MTEVMDAHAFHGGEEQAQRRWHTAALWDDARKARLLWDHIPSALHARVEAAHYFFLATSAPDGRCDCSFKGGGPGLVRVLDARRLAFPDFDGNGVFMSIGNILANPHVGCLFIDFTDGARLRVNGRASIHADAAAAALFPTQRRVVMVDIEQVIPNCARHVPKLVPAR
ncbi:MAG: pyridoxamine 5'-phosphate oxidase family protein [Burkholderiales bacterium]|nr:pyridoxamine 5'-phosphate oxidase family protein [Burkholderiales bacterium]